VFFFDAQYLKTCIIFIIHFRTQVLKNIQSYYVIPFLLLEVNDEASDTSYIVLI